MKKIKTISAIISAAFVLFISVVLITEKCSDYRIITGTADGDTLNIIFSVCAVIFLLISAITAIISKNEKRVVSNTIIRFLCVCGLCIFALITSTVRKDCVYYDFISPDGEHTVVAEEWSYLLGGGVNFYERINPLFVVCKEIFSTDDGYRAISSGDYSVEWNKNIMCITMQDGNRNYKTVKIGTKI